MKVLAFLFVVILGTNVLAQNPASPTFNPPQNPYVDSLTNTFTWEPPLPDTMQVISYKIYLDSVPKGNRTGLSYTFSWVDFGETHTACVEAVYETGSSEWVCYTFTSAYVHPPEDLEGGNYGTAASLDWWPYGSGDSLFGFNVYRDGILQDFISFENGGKQFWMDYGLDIGTYSYTVTALHELSEYGYPGDTAESAHEGPIYVDIIHEGNLPFMEDWDTGSLGYNNWITQCGTWVIDSTLGVDEPSIRFTSPTTVGQYSCGLISDTISGQYYASSKMILRFDIKYEAADTSNMDSCIVKIYNGNWEDVFVISSQDSLEWTAYSFDISEYASGNPFKVGFFMDGEYSGTVCKWYLDNIYIAPSCSPPINLTSDWWDILDPYAEVTLSWSSPIAYYGEWVSYNDGTFENAICSTDGGAGLAQAFFPEEYPCTIKKIRCFVTNYLEYGQACDVYILTEDGSTVLGGPYVFENSEPNSWVELEIEDVSVYSGNFLVATFNQIADGPFIGIDDSDYNGSLYFGSIGDFTEMGEFGYFYMGSHEVFVEYASMNQDATKEVLGYNLYRYEGFKDMELINSEPILDTFYVDTLRAYGYYNYVSTAVYEYCESEYSNSHPVWFITGIDEVSEEVITIHPNPSSGQFKLNSENVIEKVTVFNLMGELVYEKIVKNSNIELDLTHLPNSTNILKIDTEKGCFTTRIFIMK